MKIKNYRTPILLFLLIIFSSCTKKEHLEDEKVKENKSPTCTIGFIVRSFFDKDSLIANEAVDSYSEKNNIETIFTTARTSETLLQNIDLLTEKGAKGIIISSPDPKLGPAIYSRANRLGINILSIRNRLMNLEGMYMDKVPFLGISTAKTSNLIADIITKTIKENNLSIKNTGILFIKEAPDTIFEACINKTISILDKKIPNKNLFNCYAIPAPDGVIVSPIDLAKIKAGHFKKWIIFGFDIRKTENIAKLLATRYPMHNTNDIYSLSVVFNINYMNKNIMPVNYIGSIYIDPKQYGYKSIEIMYNWINNNPPEIFTEINTKFIVNPNYKPNKLISN